MLTLAAQPKISEMDAINRFLIEPTEESFRPLAVVLSHKLLRYFAFRGCDACLAEDLTQDVLFSVYRNVRALKQRASFRGWVYQIAHHALVEHHRRAKRQVPSISLEDLPPYRSGMNVMAAQPLSATTFAKWMTWLEPEVQQIMILRFVESLEYHEIAEALKIPIGTVQSRIFTAKRKLAARLKEEDA